MRHSELTFVSKQDMIDSVKVAVNDSVSLRYRFTGKEDLTLDWPLPCTDYKARVNELVKLVMDRLTA